MGLFDGLEQYRPQLPEEQGAKRSGLFSGLEQYRPKAPTRSRNLGFDFDKILSEEGTRPEIAEVFAGQESGWNPNAESVDAARGLFQVIPDTFKRFAKPGEKYDNPADVARVGARMLAKFDRDYGGDIDRIAVAHFSGEGNVAPPGYATPWRKDTADGQGKRVSSYVPDVRKRLEGLGRPTGKGEIIPIDDQNPRAVDTTQGQPDRGEFKKGWLAQIMGGTPSASGQVVQGFADIAFEQDSALGQRLQALGKRLEAMSEEEFRKYQGKVDSLKDVGEADDVLDGLSKLGDFIAYSGGSGAASLAQIAAGAGAGALVGAPAGPFGATAGAVAGGFTTSYLLAYGEARKTALSDPQIQRLIKDGKIRASDISINARGAATLVAALDMLGAERILGAVFRQAKQDLIRRAVLGGITGGSAEGGTEGLQALVTEWFRQYMGSDIPTDWWNVIDSVAAGTVVGGPVGAVSNAASRPAKPGHQVNPYLEDQGEQPVSGTEGLGQEPEQAAATEQDEAAPAVPPAVPALTPQAAQEELANIEASLLPGEPAPPELQARIAELRQATQNLAAAPQGLAGAEQELPAETPPEAIQAPPDTPPIDPVAQAADAIRAEMGAEPVHEEQRIADALEEMPATDGVQAPEPVEPPAVPESQAPDAEGSGSLPDTAVVPDGAPMDVAPVQEEQAALSPDTAQEPVALERQQELAEAAPERLQADAVPQQPVSPPRPSMLIARELAGARLPASLPGPQWEVAIAQSAPNLLNRMRKSGVFEWAAAQETLSKDELIARLTPAKAPEDAPKRLRRLDKLIDILEKVRACTRSGALNDCLAKAGKALPKVQVDDVRARAARLRKTGMGPQQAAEAAISDLIGELLAERAELAGEIRAAGGTAAERAQPVATAAQPSAQEPEARVEPTMSEVSELPQEARKEPVLAPNETAPAQPAADSAPEPKQGKEIERFTGMYRKGMRQQNAVEAQKRLTKEKPDLDWRVESDEQFGPDKYSVVGYEKTKDQEDLEARDKAAEDAAATQRAEDQDAERKAKADHERDDFALTGSDRASDANPGQSDLLASNSLPIQDVGEKIGGARKDMAASSGPRSTTQKDDSPGWRKRYSVSQIVKDTKSGEEGRWVINDLRNKDWTGRPRQIGNSFASQEEAEAAVPIAEVARNHRVGYTKDENGAEKYVIWRNVTDRKRVQVVQQLFASDAEAKRYMAQNAVSIIETKTSFGEEILPSPDRVRREGPKRRDGDVAGEDFLDAFGFKAVEFGNWEAQDERQTAMNHAYDALMDLADVLGVPPAALGLNGELALAFGARGHGLSGARAHYERDYGVINLTKMKGAGSLAHEWMHSADHYFSRQDGKASSKREKNERGDMVWKDAISTEKSYASHGTSRDSKMRAELKAAYDAVMDAIRYKAEQYVEDTQKADRFVSEARDGVAGRLQRIRDSLSSTLEWGPKAKRAPASAEQLARFDEIAEKIIAGEYLELEWRQRPGSKAKWGGYQWSNDGLDALGALYKEVRWRVGMTAQGGPITELAGDVKLYGARLKMLADAQAQTTKTRKLPTTFATEAKRIDQGRASDYWATPHEMLARAFQSYVEDRVADRGGKSDFLTYGTNTVVPTPWGWARPFPTGSEREAINTAFDKFIEVLQTKETEQGTAMFMRSRVTETPEFRAWFGESKVVDSQGQPLFDRRAQGSAVGMERDALWKSLEPVIAGWQNGPKAVEVIQSYEDLPPALYRDAKQAGAIDPGSKLHGVYNPADRTVYLIADTIPNATFGQFVLLHETLGHFGLRSILGKRYAWVMRSLYERNANVRMAADKQIEEFGYNLELAVEEVLSDMAASGKPLWGWKQVLAGILDWIRALGWSHLANMIEKLTDAEALRLVGQARSFVEKGERPRFYRQEQVPAFARKDGGPVFSRSTRRPWMDSMPQATQEALRKAGAWHDEPTLSERFKEWGKDWRMRLQQGLFDQFAPVKELSYKAYMQLRLTRGADATLEAMLAYGTIEMDNDGAIDVKYEKGGFFGVLSKLEDEHDRFIAWVVGNRAERLKREGRENNFTDEDIRRLKGLIKGNLPSGKPRLQAYSDALKQLNRYNRSVMDIADKAGLIDPQSRQFWEKDFYVPFYRVMDEAGNSNAPRNFGGAVNQYAFKVLKGGAKELGDPLHNMLLNWSHLIDASLKNQAAREALKEAEKQGIAIEADEATARQIAKAMGKKENEAVVSVVDQGVRRWFLVDDPLVLDALRAIGFSGFQFQPLKLMAKFKRLLTFGVTIDPTFRIRNLIRDSLSMIGTNQANYNVLSNLITGWKATREGEEVMGHILAGGGLIRFGSLTEGDRAEHAKKLIQAGIEDKTVLDSQSKVWAMLQKSYDWWMHVGDRAENVNRAALYQKLRDEGKSHLEASYMTRDVMDFSLMGTWGAIRFLAQVVPFFNARMQGMYKLGRGAAEDPRRFAAVTGATALASVALLLAYKDDEDWKKREDWDRETYWWFKVGDTAYRIPKPFEIGVLASIVERGTEALLTDELTGKQFAERLGSMVWNQLSMNPIPQMFQPTIELWANKDFFTGRPIESAGMQRLSPKERVGANTSAVAQALGQNNVVSPVQIDHLIHGYLGWLGLAVTSTVDTFARELPLGLPERPSRRLDDIPVLGSFAKELPAYQSRYVTQLYDQARDAQQLMADIKHAQTTGNLEKAKELASDRDKVTDAQALIRAERTLGQLNAQIRMVQVQRIPAKEKRARLDRLYETRNRLAQLTIEETRRSR